MPIPVNSDLLTNHCIIDGDVGRRCVTLLKFSLLYDVTSALSLVVFGVSATLLFVST